MEKNRLLETFEENEGKNEKYFMPFLVCGDPSINELKQYEIVIVNLSGSGSKDLDIIKQHVEFKTK